jgi:hypothetical protein
LLAQIWSDFFPNKKHRLSEFFCFRQRFIQQARADGIPVGDDFKFYE